MPKIELTVDVQASVVVDLPDCYTLNQAVALAYEVVTCLNANQAIPEAFARHMPPNHSWPVDKEATGQWEFIDACED